MINHGRTLLLNKDGASRPVPDFFLEEYVPADFLSINLPQYLRTVRDILLGGDRADNAYLNYRLWNIFRLIHSTEFADYLTALDSRITYMTDRSVVTQSTTNSYAPLNTAAENIELFFVGGVTPGVEPVIQHTWTAEVIAGLLASTTSLASGRTQETTITITEGLSSPVALADQDNFGFRIKADPLPVGAQWQLSSFVMPDEDVTDMLGPLSRLGDEVLASLFGNEEPYKTFKELWDKHFHPHYRIAGMVLAWIYRAEGVRLSGG